MLTLTIKLEGPPGTGKTLFLSLLARSLEKETRGVGKVVHDKEANTIVSTLPDDFIQASIEFAMGLLK